MACGFYMECPIMSKNASITGNGFVCIRRHVFLENKVAFAAELEIPIRLLHRNPEHTPAKPEKSLHALRRARLQEGFFLRALALFLAGVANFNSSFLFVIACHCPV